jgi:holo-[acyl-carrier protein] synthase
VASDRAVIRGIGIDLVNVGRLERAVERWGDRFLERVFTAAEIEVCRQRARPGQCLAVRFAAKEAFAKALGLGMRQGVRWRDIEVVHDDQGKPALHLHNESARLLEMLAVGKTWLSLSHEGESGIALVLLEGQPEQPPSEQRSGRRDR